LTINGSTLNDVTFDVTKMTWDIQGTSATDFTFETTDLVGEPTVTGSQISMQLTAEASDALEGLAGFAGSVEDSFDFGADAWTDTAGNTSAAIANQTITLNLLGTDNDDVIYGGSAGDTLKGGLGGDTIIGRDGADSLSGGGGADIFVYLSDVTHSENSAGHFDTITDFNTFEDFIDAQELVFGNGFVGYDYLGSFSDITAANSAIDSSVGQLDFVYVESEGALYADVDNDGVISSGDLKVVLNLGNPSGFSAENIISDNYILLGTNPGTLQLLFDTNNNGGYGDAHGTGTTSNWDNDQVTTDWNIRGATEATYQEGNFLIAPTSFGGTGDDAVDNDQMEVYLGTYDGTTFDVRANGDTGSDDGSNLNGSTHTLLMFDNDPNDVSSNDPYFLDAVVLEGIFYEDGWSFGVDGPITLPSGYQFIEWNEIV
jgi:hypothetical protein